MDIKRRMLKFLCFSGSRAMVNEFSCVCLHSDRSVHERRENLNKFKVLLGLLDVRFFADFSQGVHSQQVSSKIA